MVVAKGEKGKKIGVRGQEQMIVWQNIYNLDSCFQALWKKIPKYELFITLYRRTV